MGNLGHALAGALSGHRVVALVRSPEKAPVHDWVQFCPGSLEEHPHGLSRDIDVVIHCAASTAFRAPLADLRATNVEGTQRLLEWSAGCAHLRRWIHVSTVCIAGDRTGRIDEAPIAEPPGFTNPYEQSKWEAEQVVLASGLPVEIVRVSTVVGREEDGTVRRLGALHHLVHWLWRGLVPMVPGDVSTPVDLVSTEFAVRVMDGLLNETVCPGRIVHAAAGDSAPRLGEVLEVLRDVFRRHHDGWRRGVLALPDFADTATWAQFARSTAQSGDVLFQRVVADAQSFLPALLHPRIYATDFASRYPLGDWRVLIERNAEWLIRTQWRPQNALT
jgi:nucleoside-diphosphate-sugar epimerase